MLDLVANVVSVPRAWGGPSAVPITSLEVLREEHSASDHCAGDFAP